jgi:lipopolysaccharide assembly outer membrane protein LptD (OstA)
VFLYSEENFVKAIGNTRLQNADGSVITAGEMEYDGNTQKGVARKMLFLPIQTNHKNRCSVLRQTGQSGLF